VADYAHRMTDKELAKMERHLTEIYQRAHKELSEKADKYFAQFERLDEQKKALVKAGKMTEQEYKIWRQNKIMTGKHWTAMKEQTAQELSHVNQMAADYVNGRLPNVYSINYNDVGKGLESAVKGYSFELVDASTVKNLATSDKTLLPYKYVDGKKDVRWNTQKVNAEVLQGIIQGESIPNIAKRLTNVMGMNMASAIRNARTTVTSAENKGRMDSLHVAAEKGVIAHKIWMATHDSRTREAHIELDGQEQEIDNPFESELGDIMYPGDPEADPANVYNCFIGKTNIASDSEIVRSYKHEYSGKLVTVKTAGGVNFTCTPNHPILTVGGWVKAESLQNGDNLIVTFGQKDFSLRINPNVNHAFPRIDAIHEFLDKTGGERTCSLSVDFHGDIPTSDVEIITKKGLLREGRNSSVFNSINKFLLKHTDKSFLRDSTFVKHFWRVCKSALCIVSGFSKAFPLVWRSLRHSEIHRFRPIALLYSDGVKPLNNDVARNAELLGECLNGFSGVVFADNIVSVDFSSGCSHVYNLQTENGYYFVNSSIAQSKQKSNGIFAIAHNCRCTLTYKVVGFGENNNIENLGAQEFERLEPNNSSVVIAEKEASKNIEKLKEETKKPITNAKIDKMSRSQLEKTARKIYVANGGHMGFTEEKANKVFNDLIGSNSTTYLRKYIKKYRKLL